MVLKWFTYENGMNIIVPLKCGTRWLEEKTNPIEIKEEWLNGNFQIKGFKQNTYWVYRDGKEHLESALKTEIRSFLEFDKIDTSIDTIVNSFLNGEGTHWSPNMFFEMYWYWNRNKFNIIELNNISCLFPNIEFDSLNYSFGNYIKTNNDTKTIIDMINKEDMDKMYDMVIKDTIYLNKILINQRDIL